jgi:hypothetical protein
MRECSAAAIRHITAPIKINPSLPPFPLRLTHTLPTHTVPGIAAYLKENLGAGSVVGIDPTVHPAKFVRALAKALAGKQIRVRPLGACLFGLVLIGEGIEEMKVH